MHAATGHVILAHQSEDARERAYDEWRQETGKRKPSDLDEHLAKIAARGYERRASYEVAGVVNIASLSSTCRGKPSQACQFLS